MVIFWHANRHAHAAVAVALLEELIARWLVLLL